MDAPRRPLQYCQPERASRREEWRLVLGIPAAVLTLGLHGAMLLMLVDRDLVRLAAWTVCGPLRALHLL